ncbi:MULTISPECIES: hypothetical protein [unclassified Kribbella]|uniref:hypothetical protein n=1 Tax=unclassified Kribbella TaxID=2644121 RepID=UPI00301973DB
MAPAPERPLEPAVLHRAFEVERPLDWGGGEAVSAAEIARVHGVDATWRALWLLERAVVAEQVLTADFLASLPPGAAPYKLEKRVKSPESLARKIREWKEAERRFPVDDLLRYTVLTETPDGLVAAARRTVDALNDCDWRVTSAMHSYTEGSPYKGLHACLTPHGFARVEVQFHSAESAKVKELTTPWSQIERSATATSEERAAARQRRVDLSATLQTPNDINKLTRLGGRRVVVVNHTESPVRQQHGLLCSARQAFSTVFDRKDGIAR